MSDEFAQLYCVHLWVKTKSFRFSQSRWFCFFVLIHRPCSPYHSPSSTLTRPPPFTSLFPPVHPPLPSSFHSIHSHSNPSNPLSSPNPLRRISFISDLPLLRLDLKKNSHLGRFRLFEDPQRKHHLPPFLGSSPPSFETTRCLLPWTLVSLFRGTRTSRPPPTFTVISFYVIKSVSLCSNRTPLASTGILRGSPFNLFFPWSDTRNDGLRNSGMLEVDQRRDCRVRRW